MLGRGAQVLIVGGTRYLGRILCVQALELGAEVTLLNRGRTESGWIEAAGYRVRRVQGERRDPAVLAQALDRTYDAVFDMIAYRPEDIVPMLAPPLAVRTGHLLVCSTTSVYGPALYQPIDEAHPRGPHPAWGEYNRGKNAVEDALEAASAVRWTVLRPQWVFGPHDYQHLAEYYLVRCAAGLPIWLWHPGVAQLNWTYAPDLAAAFLQLAGEPRAAGQAFNVCCAETLSGLDLVDLCGQVVGVRPEVRRYDPEELPAELRGTRLGPVRNLPLACTAERLAGTVAWRPTGMRAALAAIVEWLRTTGAPSAVQPLPAEAWLNGQRA